MSIAQFVNQNSFIVVSAVALGGAMLFLIARRARLRFWLIWIAAGAVAIGVNLAMRTPPARTFESVADVQKAVASGTPTLIEFYSNY